MDKGLEKIKAVLASGKGGKWLVAAGIAGILLIFLSAFFTGGGGETAAKSDAAAALTDQEYRELLEKQVAGMVTGITGSERVSVMITLRTGTEYVYANDKKSDTDVTDAESGSLRQKGSTEENYIMVEDANGNKVALLVTSYAPTVQGVVVVCEGGGEDSLRTRIEEAVKTALGISSRKVCVTGMSG